MLFRKTRQAAADGRTLAGINYVGEQIRLGIKKDDGLGIARAGQIKCRIPLKFPPDNF